jgi:hypothetical protein
MSLSVVYSNKSARLASVLLCVMASLFLRAVMAQAQSTDPTFPTPVGSREIDGAIAARDIGDGRLTDHFYGFAGVPGDFYITVRTKNLNGDIDIFTAGELRPLMKITIYAESTTAVTKNLYFRKNERLILRVEARTPNDEDGTYHISFSGSFEPIPGGVLLAESEKQSSEREKQPAKSGNRRGTRVSSVGARIEEPEVAVAPTPEPSPMETPSPETAKPSSTKPVRNTNARNARGRRTPTRKPANSSANETANKPTAESGKVSESSEATPGETTKTEAPKTEPPKTENTTGTKPSTEENPPNTETSEANTEKKTPPARRGNSRRNPATRAKAEPPENNARLVIQERDGTQIEYLMINVKRVTVENGVIVIVSTDDVVTRVPMAKVLRMSIGP